MMASLISFECVVPLLRSRDVQHVVDELSRVVATEAVLDNESVCRSVLEQAEESTFGFGRGVAVPHAAFPGLDRPVGAFARLKPAHDFGASDGISADLVFLLLSPEGNDSTHLRALACVTRRLRDREVATRLRSSTDAAAIHVVLTSDIWRSSGIPAMPSPG